MERLDVVYVAILNEDETKILLVQNENGEWSLPGGKREEGETLECAAKREVLEETGFVVSIHQLISLNEKVDSSHDLFFTYKGIIERKAKDMTIDSDIKQIRWVSIKEADQLIRWYKGGISNYIKLEGARYVDEVKEGLLEK